MPLGRTMRKAAVQRKLAVLSAFVLTIALISGSAFAVTSLIGETHFDGRATLDFDLTQLGLDGCLCDCASFWLGEHHVYFVPKNPVTIDEYGTPSQTYRAVSGRFVATMWLEHSDGFQLQSTDYRVAYFAQLWLQVADAEAVSLFVPLNQDFAVALYINGFSYEVTVYGVTYGVLIAGGSIAVVSTPHFCEMFCENCPLVNRQQDFTPMPAPMPVPMPVPEPPTETPVPDGERDNETDEESDDEIVVPEYPPVLKPEYEDGYDYEYDYDYEHDYDYGYDYSDNYDYEHDYDYDSDNTTP